MTIARALLATIPIGMAVAIARTNSPAFGGFIYVWANFLSVFGFSAHQVNTVEAPPSFHLGAMVGLFSVMVSAVFSVFAFCVAWAELGPSDDGDEQ